MANYVCACAVVFVLAAAGAAAGADGGSVLDTYSYWRSFVMIRPVVAASTAKGATIPEGIPRSPAPPEGWTAPDFDDSSWYRVCGPIRGGYGRRSGQGVALMCLRGRFHVNDPSGVQSLKLSVAFRGGVVVYLNGAEIGRAHLPEGTITPETIAEAYPLAASVMSDGKGFDRRTKSDEAKAGMAMRIRGMEDVSVPVKGLRKGVNTLCIELHRSPVNPESLEIKSAFKYAWTKLGLNRVALTASPEGAVTANLCRPAGIQVWNAGPMTSVFDLDYGDPNESLGPIRLAGTRNGLFSGQVVVSSDGPIKNLAAVAGPFTMKGGAGEIAAEHVRVRFGIPNGAENDTRGRFRSGGPVRFDALGKTAPAEVPVREVKLKKGYAGPALVPGAVQPVWVSVKVPAEVAPGQYDGTLTISAEGLPATAVAVQLSIAGWAMPNPNDFVSHVGITQSIESVALYYKVPLWSNEHWALVERSLEVLGEAGVRSVFLPLVARHHYGKEGLVRWIDKGDGTYDYDLSLLETYAKLAVKHLGALRVACLYVWEPRYRTYSSYNKKHEDKKTAPVNVLDPKTGTVTELLSPLYSLPESADFWKPVLERSRECLVKCGVNDEAIMIGIASDQVPAKDEVEMFKTAAPWAKWVKQAHGLSSNFYGVPVGHAAHVWGTKGIADPAEKRVYGWKRKGIVTQFPRTGSKRFLKKATVLPNCWTIQEAMMCSEYRGFARTGADFWPIPSGTKRRYGGGTLAGMYASWGQTTISESTLDLLHPGPDGAVPSIRLESVRQGVQETEARIIIEKALVDTALRAKLGAELADRCQALLDERTYLLIAYREAPVWFSASGWQARDRRLFEAAAEVVTALRGAK